MSSSIVKLNVGGRKFYTTKSTLCTAGQNFFSALLSGRFNSEIDPNGFTVIDRNGDLFAPLLDFLRTGNLYIPPSLCIEVAM